MSLYDFFFPEQAQAQHLRTLTQQGDASRWNLERRTGQLDDRIDSLESDLGYVTLVLGSLLESLDEKGVLTRDDVKSVVTKLDAIDGVSDGRLDINFLRGRHA